MSIMSERLTQLREQNKLSQSDVALRLNVSAALISAYERDERKPSIDNLILLADIYHVTTDYILGRTMTNNNNDIILNVSHLSERQIKLLNGFINEMSRNK